MKQSWIPKVLFYLSLAGTGTLPAIAAEQVSFRYGALQLTLPVTSIDTFVKEGKVTNDLGFYAQYIQPKDLQTWRGFLQIRLNISPVIVSQFTYSPVGEKILQRLGEVFQMDPHLNGFHALRSALILSAADPKEGLTILNVLHRFPSTNLRLNISRGLEIANNAGELIQKKGAVVSAIQKIAEASSSEKSNDVPSTGTVKLPNKWQKQTLSLSDRARNREFQADIYLPQANQPAPLILISHGVGEDRESFAYLAQYLASQGFAVAVPAHPGSDAKKFQEYFAGLAISPDPMELINQPLDLKFLLDELEQRSPSLRSRLNLQQVGLIGHSQGGYAVLALAGASLNFANLQKDCQDDQSLNLALFAQCEALKLPQRNYDLKDQRIKAAIAINPMSSSIFGQQGMSQISIPIMLVTSTEDVVTPMVPEQVRPFTWLTQPYKYLVMIENGTHFSALQQTKSSLRLPIPVNVIGPNPEIAHSYVNALSLSFFRSHLTANPNDSNLNGLYVKSLSQAPLNLSLIRALTPKDLEQALK